MPTGEEESFFKQAAYFWKSVESLRGKIEFHARILQCPAEWKKSLNVWGAQPADIALMQRVKKSFDPQNILAPGRFTGGI
jgi:glycolate oxidase FAD binding subunit